MTEIERVKKSIEILEERLAFLKEIENKPKTPEEEAYKELYGTYPSVDDLCGKGGNSVSWSAFRNGYQIAREKYEKKYEQKLEYKPEIDNSLEVQPNETLYGTLKNWWNQKNKK